jgi:hypothetical protein
MADVPENVDDELRGNVECLTSVQANYSHDPDVLVVCGWIEQLIPMLLFADAELTACENGNPPVQYAFDPDEEEENEKAIVQIFDLIMAVEEKYPIDPEVLWVCDTAARLSEYLLEVADELASYTYVHGEELVSNDKNLIHLQ